jgi:glutathione S-transferase
MPDCRSESGERWRCTHRRIKHHNGTRTMLTFFDYLPSQNSFKIRLLLNQLQIPHRTQILSIFEGEGKTAAYRRINPTGAVPAITLADGRSIAESNAILAYLAEGSPYLPDGRYERAKVNQWLSFEQDYVQNTIGSLRYWTMTSKLDSRPSALVASKRSAATTALAILDAALTDRPFICGDDYTIADMSLFAYASRAEEADIALAGYAAFRAWVERVASQPGFVGQVHPYAIDPHSLAELG